MTEVRGAQLKIERALEHLNFISAKAAEFVEGNLYFMAEPIKDERGDEWDILRWVEKQPPYETFGVWLGDFIHNIRSALDYCVYAAVLESNEDPGEHTQFPIYDNRNLWIRDIEKRDPTLKPSPIFGISPDSQEFAIIEKAQPYRLRTPKQRLRHPLYELLRMSNIDKHQKLHAARALSMQPVIRYLPPGTFRITRKRWATGYETVDDGAEICRVQRKLIGTAPPSPDVGVNIRGNAYLAFREPGKRADIATSPELAAIYDMAARIVLAFSGIGTT